MVRRLLAALAPALLVAACGSGGHTNRSTDDHQQHTVDEELRRRHSDDRDHRSGGAQRDHEQRPRARRPRRTPSPATRTLTSPSRRRISSSSSTVGAGRHADAAFRSRSAATRTVYLSVSNASGGPLKLALRARRQDRVHADAADRYPSTTKLPSLEQRRPTRSCSTARHGAHSRSAPRPVRKPAGSADPRAGLGTADGTQQHDPARIVERAEHEYLGHERPDLSWREVDDRDHERVEQLLARVVRDLRRRALDAKLWTRSRSSTSKPGLRASGKSSTAVNATDPHVDRP